MVATGTKILVLSSGFVKKAGTFIVSVLKSLQLI